jgi:hypothetical protein
MLNTHFRLGPETRETGGVPQQQGQGSVGYDTSHLILHVMLPALFMPPYQAILVLS